MTAHPVADLPAYVNATLSPRDHAEVSAHLAACPTCRAEVADWQAVARATAALGSAVGAPPDDLLARVEARLPAPAAVPALAPPAPPPARRPLRGAVALVRGQVPLIRRGLWAASSLMFMLGAAITLADPTLDGMVVLPLVAPVVAAVGVALVYGPENDPGLEIALSTPTSPRAVLLARLALVVGYDLALALLANALVAAVDPELAFWPLVSSWLAPMFLLSSLSLLLSLVVGTASAVTVTLGLWSLHHMTRMTWTGLREDGLIEPVGWAWGIDIAGPIAWLLAAALTLVAFWFAPRREVSS